MKALSIRQPWAWLILHAGKDVENRNWPTQFRGPCLIHASKGITRDEYADAFDFFASIELSGQIAIPTFEELPIGGIVGKMFIEDCVKASKSPWFFGTYGFVITSAMTLPFFPCRGALGFFDAPDMEAQPILL